MRRLVSPFLLILTALMAGAFAYVAWRLTDLWWWRVLLGVPFVLVWLIPVLYWTLERDARSRGDHWLQYAAYVSMGWLSFVLMLVFARDAILLAGFFPWLDGNRAGAGIVGLSVLGVLLGVLRATKGPALVSVDIVVKDLPSHLEGLRIVQISDLHVGPTIHKPYVDSVVARANAAMPDIVAITGDLVDGEVAALAPHMTSLALVAPDKPRFFITGNHEYYSGGAAWCAHVASLGYQVLLNEHAVVQYGGGELLVAGVVDPAVKMEDRNMRPDPAGALQRGPAADRLPAYKILLAHNPKLAKAGAAAGYNLQLSGHTHAGQFFPWTVVTWFVHKPHYVGLSKQGPMWVYVSAGTGSWGPPIRLGTKTELTLLRLTKGQI